ncbi:MAG: type II toxin-antitoxin system VapC family toxin [Patescibacteria group bacterium]
MLVLDTNILIYYLKDDKPISRWLEAMVLKGEHFAGSTITVAELLGYTKITNEQTFLIEQILRTLVLVDVDLMVAREAARLRRIYRFKTVDSIIAATAVLLHAPLVTRDAVFKKLRGCRIITP